MQRSGFQQVSVQPREATDIDVVRAGQGTNGSQAVATACKEPLATRADYGACAEHVYL
jgi:hypothetical protein